MKESNFTNKAEEFVYRVCRKSFLSLWSYANPRGKEPGKELCDILVVCEPYVIIFSVKDIKVRKSVDISIDWERWYKHAIEESCNQIYGAERWIKSATHVIRKDGTPGLPFPKVRNRRIHRIAVALGGEGKAPIPFGDFGKGFVHVFDEVSFYIVMQELDTISDFIKYLIDKENLYDSGVKTILQGAEEDLLALYLHNGRKFPTNYSAISVDNTLWKSFKNKKEYKAKKIADRDSYVWDRLIEAFCKDILHGNLEFGNSLTEAEIVTRTMAREDRFGRRILGKSFKEFIDLSRQNKVRSRMLPSPSGVLYVFLALPHGEDRKFRIAELGNRCFVARGLNQKCKTVIGIATEQYEPGKGFSLDSCYIYKPTWTDKDQAYLENMQKELGYFSKSVQTRNEEDEYPEN